MLLRTLALAEGDLLLMAGGALSWATEITLSLPLIAPGLIGLVAGIKAVRRGGRALAWLQQGVNARPLPGGMRRHLPIPEPARPLAV